MKKWVVRVRCQFSSPSSTTKEKREKNKRERKRKEKNGPKTHHVFCF
jgi:hypothetical protein